MAPTQEEFPLHFFGASSVRTDFPQPFSFKAEKNDLFGLRRTFIYAILSSPFQTPMLQ